MASALSVIFMNITPPGASLGCNHRPDHKTTDFAMRRVRWFTGGTFFALGRRHHFRARSRNSGGKDRNSRCASGRSILVGCDKGGLVSRWGLRRQTREGRRRDQTGLRSATVYRWPRIAAVPISRLRRARAQEGETELKLGWFSLVSAMPWGRSPAWICG
jgi:hypothetical protein